jgi:hypothetical protein
MGRRQKLWAYKKRLELIQELGGKCSDPLCVTPDLPLEVDHPKGRDWSSKLSPDQRVLRLLKDKAKGVPLRALCSRCNKMWRNQPDDIPPLPDGLTVSDDLPF